MSEIEVCFVHLGPMDMPHIWRNLNFVSSLHPTQKLNLIINDEKLAAKAKSLDINTFFYRSNPELDALFNKVGQNFDYAFRQGFWRFSLERLLAFKEFQETLQKPLLHIESDILVTSNFPFGKFLTLEHMAWTSLNPKSDVAALLYSPSVNHARKFVEDVRKELNSSPAHTDMTILAALRSKNPSVYKTLPSAPNDAREFTNPKNSADYSRISELTAHFGGYFDPAALGMWNVGQDARNYFGFSKRLVLMPESSVDPSKITLKILRPLVLQDQNSNFVFNLHVHSKNLRLFSNHSFQTLSRYLSGKYSSRKYIFDVRMFKELILDYSNRGKLHELVYNLPVLERAWKLPIIRSFIKKVFSRQQ